MQEGSWVKLRERGVIMCNRVSVMLHVGVRVLVVVHDLLWRLGVPMYVIEIVEEPRVSKVCMSRRV